MNLMSLKNWITVGGGAFLTGAMGFASTHLSSGIPSTAQQWEAFGIGCLVGGVVAVTHLYVNKPGGLDAAAAKRPEADIVS